MSKAVFCITHFQGAETILTQLRDAGFTPNDISVLLADQKGTRDFAVEHNTKAPEGTAAGVGAGATLGGVLGWLAGIGSLAIPGLGPLIAAGPIVGTLTGAAVGGTLGGLTGALIGMGIPEFEARKYEGKVKAGNVLISVHTDTSDEVDRAKRIFEENGAEDVATGSEAAATSRT